MVDPPCGKIAGHAAGRPLAMPSSRLRQGPEPHLADHARHAEVVDAVVLEEALVLGGENGGAHHAGGISRSE